MLLGLHPVSAGARTIANDAVGPFETRAAQFALLVLAVGGECGLEHGASGRAGWPCVLWGMLLFSMRCINSAHIPPHYALVANKHTPI